MKNLPGKTKNAVRKRDSRSRRPRAPQPVSDAREKRARAFRSEGWRARHSDALRERDDPADARGRIQGRSGAKAKAGALGAGPPSRRETGVTRARAPEPHSRGSGPRGVVAKSDAFAGVTDAGASFAR